MSVGLPNRPEQELRKRTLHFLHVPKTGGTAIRTALVGLLDGGRLQLHGHGASSRSIPPGDSYFFVLRDPVSRFVSAFYSRQRRGRPRYDYAWTPEEARMFERFSTPRALAEALGSEGDRRKAAERAMRAVPHFRPMQHWTGSAAEVYSDRARVFAVLFQETLEEDFSELTSRLRVRATLPSDAVQAHRNPEILDRAMPGSATETLQRWYADDYELLRAAREIRSHR